MESDKLIVLCTVGDAEEGQEIAKALVKEQLAACVNLIPGLKSIYRYKGKVHEDEEILLLIKSSKSLFPVLEEWIKELHSYEVPEIVALEPHNMSGTFDAWWDEQLVDPADIEG